MKPMPDAALLLTKADFRKRVNAAIIRQLNRRWRSPGGASLDDWAEWKRWHHARVDYLRGLIGAKRERTD